MAANTDVVPTKTADESKALAIKGDESDEEEVTPEGKSVFDIKYDFPPVTTLEKELRSSISINDWVKQKEPDMMEFMAKEFGGKSGLEHEDIMIGVSCAIYDYFKKKEKEMGDKEFVMYKFNYAAALVHIGKGNQLDE